MELYRDLLVKLLENEEIRIEFPNLSISLSELVEMRCYNALKEIKAIIEDDRYSDKECVMKIEKIVCLLEDLESDGGLRHDF